MGHWSIFILFLGHLIKAERWNIWEFGSVLDRNSVSLKNIGHKKRGFDWKVEQVSWIKERIGRSSLLHKNRYCLEISVVFLFG